MIREALKLVNTRFRAIPTLETVLVEMFKDGPGGYIRKEKESRMYN